MTRPNYFQLKNNIFNKFTDGHWVDNKDLWMRRYKMHWLNQILDFISVKSVISGILFFLFSVSSSTKRKPYTYLCYTIDMSAKCEALKKNLVSGKHLIKGYY